jgi:ATP-dependent RNA helicase DeaD
MGKVRLLMDKLTFDQLGLSPEIQKAVAALGFEEAAPIQAEAIPVLLAGKDVVGQSQTGSGKTAAFAIPAIEMTVSSERAVQVLVLCPARELATQVAEEFHKLAAFKRGVHALPVYGGASFERQAYEIKRGAQIVIGTPGRVIDHLERGTLKLDRVRFVVLDEADRMLDMGFRDDIRKILDAVPESRQTAFFSATVSAAIRGLINRYARDPVTLDIKQKEVSAPAIEQWFYEVPPRGKFDALLRLIDFHSFRSGVIFCNTQRMVDQLADDLQAQGVPSDRLHGGIAQAQRTRVMDKFKRAGFEFLVATDVAARGIDVNDLELVVNFDLPYDPEDYVHRIGRTGRAGKRGMAVTLVGGRDLRKIQFLERFAHTKIRRGTLPTAGEIGEKRADALLARIRGVIDDGSWRQHAGMVDRLLDEGIDSTEIAAALFHLLSGPAPVAPAEKPPEPAAPSTSEPSVRNPSSGKLWLRIGLGRQEFGNARDLIDLMVEGAGLAPQDIGLIDMGEESCLVEAPASFVQGLSPHGNMMETARGTITITPLPTRKKVAGKKRR